MGQGYLRLFLYKCYVRQLYTGCFNLWQLQSHLDAHRSPPIIVPIASRDDLSTPALIKVNRRCTSPFPFFLSFSNPKQGIRASGHGTSELQQRIGMTLKISALRKQAIVDT
jgi:hypothetical protein